MTLTFTTVLPAPTNVVVQIVNGDQLEITWTDNATSNDGYRVHVSRDGGVNWTEVADIGPSRTSYTTSSLLDGEEYAVLVEAYTEHVTEPYEYTVSGLGFTAGATPESSSVGVSFSESGEYIDDITSIGFE